ncbi:MAG: NHLP-related RiPP peptide [Dokdonella sp.]
MSDARLTKEPGLSLMMRLADDDGFRARFETTNARALVEIGVPAEAVVNLKADCVERRMLASKKTFWTLLRESTSEATKTLMTIVVPRIVFRKHSAAAETLAVEAAVALQQVPSSKRIAVH